MHIIGLIGSITSIRRKLRAVGAIIADPAATEHEKANAQALRARLERRLREAVVVGVNIARRPRSMTDHQRKLPCR